MMQGDALSVVLFIICFNPLSYLLRKSTGYAVGPPNERNVNITHLAFVDDFKLISNKISNAKQQLDIVTNYSKDIGMTFGVDKCAYINIEHGKRKSLGRDIYMNGVRIKELEEEETYKYLGLHESVNFCNSMNKSNAIKEYNRRLRKIWSSELNAYNKVVATNTFAVPIITYSIGLLEWTNDEIRSLDKRTRKIMNMNNSLNKRSDVDRLYIKRSCGGRGLRNIEEEFLSKIVRLCEHLIVIAPKSKYIEKVVKHENQSLFTLNELINNDLDITNDNATTSHSSIVKSKLKSIKEKQWIEKPVHGYFPKTLAKLKSDIDINQTWKWLQSSTLTSQVEGYIITLQDQEINTREARKRHEKDLNKKNLINSKCRLCKNSEENLQHILGVCPSISTNLYLNARHNPVAEIIYFEILKAKDIVLNSTKPLNVLAHKQYEVWWDQKISTAVPVAHNKPDIVIWDTSNKTCQIIDISIPLDMNIVNKGKEKRNHYMGLVTELQRVYRSYKFDIIPVIVGCLGCIPKELSENLKSLNLSNNIICKLQKTAILGSLKIVKTFMKMRD